MANSTGKRISGYLNRNVFRFSLYLKGFDAIVEICFGIILKFVKAEYINAVIISYARDELTEEPNNHFAAYFLHRTHISTETASFTAVLLLLRGVTKILVISGLLQKKIWVYPIAIGIFSGFFIFESYTFFHTHSPLLAVLALFDLFVIALTIREYRQLTLKS